MLLQTGFGRLSRVAYSEAPLRIKREDAAYNRGPMARDSKTSLPSRVFVWLAGVPLLRKTLWRSWYNYLAKRYVAHEWTFMNYGFVDPLSAHRVLLPQDEPDRLSIQLYDHVVGETDVRGRTVVEVGSGRGGGASFIQRYLGPRRTIGFDLSPAAVSFCRKTHQVDALEFQVGEASRLPLAAESVDVVVNVESSHCYPSMDEFVREVGRILKSGGWFLHADFRNEVDVSAWREAIAGAGFTIVRETDITTNVLTALEADDARKRDWIVRMIPAALRRPFSEFAGLEGTSIHEAFRARRLVYRSFAAVWSPAKPPSPRGGEFG